MNLFVCVQKSPSDDAHHWALFSSGRVQFISPATYLQGSQWGALPTVSVSQTPNPAIHLPDTNSCLFFKHLFILGRFAEAASCFSVTPCAARQTRYSPHENKLRLWLLDPELAHCCSMDECLAKGMRISYYKIQLYPNCFLIGLHSHFRGIKCMKVLYLKEEALLEPVGNYELHIKLMCFISYPLV